MLDERKASILRVVVEEYIETAQPVGSGHVARSPGMHVSSATVRNDMALLEQEGFLRQPHTSAGRIPTDKGYRYFVDSLGGDVTLDRTASQQVRAFFNHAHGEIEQMLASTTRLLADLTDYAAVVVSPPHEVATIRSVQLVGLTARVTLVVAVLSNGSIEKRTLELREELDEERLARATRALSARVVGHRVEELTTGAPRPEPTGDPLVDAVVATAMDALCAEHEGEADHVFVNGTARMTAAFDAVDTVRSVLTILEEQLVVVSLLRDVLDRGLSVAIGSETGIEPLVECSLVVAPYRIEGEEAGTIAVLGPTRMNYPQALAAVAVVSNRLSHRLSEG
jgi:heat-inducible transcriptional repressor